MFLLDMWICEPYAIGIFALSFQDKEKAAYASLKSMMLMLDTWIYDSTFVCVSLFLWLYQPPVWYTQNGKALQCVWLLLKHCNWLAPSLQLEDVACVTFWIGHHWSMPPCPCCTFLSLNSCSSQSTSYRWSVMCRYDNQPLRLNTVDIYLYSTKYVKDCCKNIQYIVS